MTYIEAVRAGKRIAVQKGVAQCIYKTIADRHKTIALAMLDNLELSDYPIACIFPSGEVEVIKLS